MGKRQIDSARARVVISADSDVDNKRASFMGKREAGSGGVRINSAVAQPGVGQAGIHLGGNRSACALNGSGYSSSSHRFPSFMFAST
jgi:hypothetical protein